MYIDAEALFDIITNSSYMEDLYYVAVEYGYTIEDIANDPHKVFDHLEGDAEYYAEEVLAELDLWTQSDRSYDFEKSARGIVKLYNEVEDYFSYDNAERLLKEYRDGVDEEY